MSAEAIHRVTTALQERLQEALGLASIDNGRVFVGPLDDAQARDATLVLFPYRIVPNASLRNGERRVPSRQPGQAYDSYVDALPLDVHYLISLGGSAAGGVADPQLRVLGFVLQAFQARPELPGSFITRSGIRMSLAPDIVRIVLEPLSTDELSRIWALFPVANYRTSVAYVASPVWIDPVEPAAGAPRVVADRLDAGHDRTAGD